MNKQLYLEVKNIFSPISKELKRVDKEIKSITKSDVSLVRDGCSHFFKRGGKQIRASLVILSSGLSGELPENIEKIAAAVELLHGATLIHDDIIDEADFRRGRETISSRWGNKTAVLLGDYFYSRSFDIALLSGRFDLYPLLVRATSEMVKGELSQLDNTSKKDFSEEYYYQLIDRKTASFMGICAEIGALFANMSEASCNNAFKMGFNMGMAFQIVDDMLDYISDSNTTGKDNGNDFLQGKVTLPVILFLNSLDKKDRESYIDILSQPEEKNWKNLKDRIIESSVLEECIKKVNYFSEKSINYLESFPSGIYKDTIYELNEFIKSRVY